MVLVVGASMSEAVRTMASPAATWAIVVTATILVLFMATVAMFMDLVVAREQRRERKLGIGPEPGTVGTQWPRLTEASTWPRLSEALLAAAGVPQSEVARIRTGVPAGDETAGDAPTMPDLPAQRAPGQDAVQLPAQRTGESDRAERSLAGPGPQDNDEDEQ